MKRALVGAALLQVEGHNHQVGLPGSILNVIMSVCLNMWARLTAWSVYRRLLIYPYHNPSY